MAGDEVDDGLGKGRAFVDGILEKLLGSCGGGEYGTWSWVEQLPVGGGLGGGEDLGEGGGARGMREYIVADIGGGAWGGRGTWHA